MNFYAQSNCYKGFRWKETGFQFPEDGDGPCFTHDGYAEFSFEQRRGFRGRVRSRKRRQRTLYLCRGNESRGQSERQVSFVFGEAGSKGEGDNQQYVEAESGLSTIERRLSEGSRIAKLVSKRFNPETIRSERLILNLTEDEMDYIASAIKIVKELYDIPNYRWKEVGLASLAKDYLTMRVFKKE